MRVFFYLFYPFPSCFYILYLHLPTPFQLLFCSALYFSHLSRQVWVFCVCVVGILLPLCLLSLSPCVQGIMDVCFPISFPKAFAFWSKATIILRHQNSNFMKSFKKMQIKSIIVMRVFKRTYYFSDFFFHFCMWFEPSKGLSHPPACSAFTYLHGCVYGHLYFSPPYQSTSNIFATFC